MDNQPPRGRGRGRGRARAIPAADRPPEPQHPPQGMPSAQAGAMATGRAVTRAGVPRGQPQVQQAPQAPPPGLAGPPGRASGRAASRAGGDPQGLATSMRGLSVAERGAVAVPGGAGDGEGGHIGRGNFRGSRQIERTALVTRPDTCRTKVGSTGQRIGIKSNYFEIITKADWSLYQYRVDFNPEEDRTFVRKALLGDHKNQIGRGYVFDGTVLYTHNRLMPDPLTLTSKRKHDDAIISITVRSVESGELMKTDPTYLQVFNIVIRKCLDSLDLKLLGRNYFDPQAKICIQEFSLELWPGYLTSMRQHENGILLCVEIIHKVIRKDTAYDLFVKCTATAKDNYKASYRTEIMGSVVLTTYGNTKTYRIDDLDFDSTPESTFDMKGKKTTYVQYYREKYGKEIRDKKQPMLISMPKARDQRAGMSGPIYLVPELCQMTGYTDEMRANTMLMKAVSDHTRMSAQTRQERLALFERRFSGTAKIVEELRHWNLNLSKSIIEFDARVLPAEKITLGNGKFFSLERGPDWTAAFRNCTMLSCMQLERWVVIAPQRSARDIQKFIQMIQQAAHGMSFQIESPRFYDIEDDRVNSCVQMLENVLSRDTPKFVMFVVGNNRADRYSAIKKKTYVDRAVPSQVMIAKTANKKGAMSVATKIAIQICCKIGGAPWAVEVPMKGLMVIGYDVCHDAQQKAKSYGAMVASLNSSLTRYFSSVSPHTSGDEVFTDLPLNIGKAIKTFKKHNNDALPSRIIIYRDGVGEGQIPVVVDKEVKAVGAALAQVYGAQVPKLTFIVVTKRLNSRFFHRHDNPPAGTVIDDKVTCPEKYDFFLISQSVRQGSVSPTGYNVIFDESGLDADKMQRLAYKMTHLYFNWSGTVRVPAPCQYAHKLAFLCGQNLHRAPNVELEDLLYFL